MKKIAVFLLLLATVFAFAACGGQEEEGSLQLIIAGKDTSEQLLVDQMLLLLIEAKTEHTAVISTNSYLLSRDLAKGAKSGDIQLYVDYDGSMFQNALDGDWSQVKKKSVASLVQDAYKTEFDLVVQDAIGFSGGYGVFITKERREELGKPENLGALTEGSSSLVIGMEKSFYERADAYDAFAGAYGFQFQAAQVYEEEEGFTALMEGKIDLMVAETTNPYYSVFDLDLMKDDKEFFMPANALPVVSAEVLTECPEIGATVALMKDLITTKTMSALIAKIELEGKNFADVAQDFLKARNLIG